MTPRARQPSRNNGRTLTDDATDAFLALLTNGRVTEDKVGPTAICSPSFPTSASAQRLAAEGGFVFVARGERSRPHQRYAA
jgi:hypothetical protein